VQDGASGTSVEDWGKRKAEGFRNESEEIKRGKIELKKHDEDQNTQETARCRVTAGRSRYSEPSRRQQTLDQRA
jgi:hypothetical protein